MKQGYYWFRSNDECVRMFRPPQDTDGWEIVWVYLANPKYRAVVKCVDEVRCLPVDEMDGEFVGPIENPQTRVDTESP